jgi:hypothetical protein
MELAGSAGAAGRARTGSFQERGVSELTEVSRIKKPGGRAENHGVGGWLWLV